MVVAQYSCDRQNEGILGVFFPKWKVVKDPLPSFIADERLVVVSERIPQAYKDKSVVQISRVSKTKLDTKEGALEFLNFEGIKVTDEMRLALMQMDDEAFWKLIKLAKIFGHIPKQNFDHSTSVFEIFKLMFESFEGVYKVFRSYQGSHKVIFSALMTMMAKTQFEDFPGISPGYKKILIKNKPFLNIYKAKVLEYLDSPMREIDFITFLAGLSEMKRSV